jgi:hypothetical protein
MTTQNKDLTIDRDSAQTKFEDLQEQVEHSLLDKEIAESELEEAQAKVKELEERVGELEVEVEVVREENGASYSVAPSSLLPLSLGKETDTWLPCAAQLDSKVRETPRSLGPLNKAAKVERRLRHRLLLLSVSLRSRMRG